MMCLTMSNDDEIFEVPETEENRIPLFLHITYIVVIIGGLCAFFAYWNGSHGFLDRGYWQPLQKAAYTTYPFEKKEPYLEQERISTIPTQ